MQSKIVRTIIFLVIVAAFAHTAGAQSNELGVTVGGYFPVNSSAGSGNAFAVGGSFAHRVFGVPFVSLYFEIPVFGTFNSTSDIVSTTQGNAKYSALFVTPGLKVKFGSVFPISPYLVAGGGLARFSKSNVTTEDTTNTGTFDIGGGLDFKIAPFVSARAEVRDFYSGNPKILQNFSDREHQLITSVGLVLRF